MYKKFIWVPLVVISFCVIFFVFVRNKNKLTVGPFSITHEAKFGGIYPDISLEEFRKAGFEFGDSIDISFSNGQKLEDVPFYNGYDVKNNEHVICGYPGYKKPLLTVYNGPDIFETMNLESSTVKFSINEKQKYIKTQNALDIVYTNNRDDYASDEVFGNFRVMNIGNLKHNLFYRSASPCDNQYNRATYVSQLCEQEKIQYIFDLADNEQETAEYNSNNNLDCPYWKDLYKNDKIFEMDMSANYTDQKFAQTAADGLTKIFQNDGPYLIHCTEGKDRTGFICLLVEALAGAKLNELEADYMKTYENYYGITKTSAPDKYKAIYDLKFSDMICFLTKTKNISDVTDEKILSGARDYLKFGGLDDNKIDSLIKKISL